MAQKHPKDCNCKDCKKAKKADSKKVVKESTQIVNFIKAMTEKNFAEANKYLQVAVESKIKSRIQQCADIKPF